MKGDVIVAQRQSRPRTAAPPPALVSKTEPIGLGDLLGAAHCAVQIAEQAIPNDVDPAMNIQPAPLGPGILHRQSATDIGHLSLDVELTQQVDPLPVVFNACIPGALGVGNVPDRLEPVISS